MLEETRPPWSWMLYALQAVQWPVAVLAAFWMGRYVQKLEMRVSKAETNITALVERHMPAIHRALAEIRGMLSR